MARHHLRPINLIEVRSKDRSPTPFLWHRLVYNKGGLHSIGERKMIRCSSNELVEPLMIKLLIGVEPEEEERCAAVQNYICLFRKLSDLGNQEYGEKTCAEHFLFQ